MRFKPVYFGVEKLAERPVWIVVCVVLPFITLLVYDQLAWRTFFVHDAIIADNLQYVIAETTASRLALQTYVASRDSVDADETNDHINRAVGAIETALDEKQVLTRSDAQEVLAKIERVADWLKPFSTTIKERLAAAESNGPEAAGDLNLDGVFEEIIRRAEAAYDDSRRLAEAQLTKRQLVSAMGLAASCALATAICVLLSTATRRHRKIEEALRDSEARYRAIFEQAANGIWIADLETGDLIDFNDHAHENLGYTREEFAALSIIDIHASFSPERVRAQFKKIVKNGSGSFETWYNTRDGAIHSVLLLCRMISLDGAKYCLAIMHDTTERRWAEAGAKAEQQQLADADKMASLGILISGVAHELNNPNHFIMGQVRPLQLVWEGALPILDEYFKQNGDFRIGGARFSVMRERIPTMMENIQEGSERIKTIVDELREYARDRPSEVVDSVDINNVVKSALTLLSGMLKNSTKHLTVDYGRDIPLLAGNYRRLEQVVINLVQNACQALPDTEAAISISTYHDSTRNATLLLIEDEGKGIHPDALGHVMDPFYTTRRDSGGTGLGLSISSSIVMEHGGRLTLDSELEKGTKASVILPTKPRERKDE